jgi:hypothetical protein
MALSGEALWKMSEIELLSPTTTPGDTMSKKIRARTASGRGSIGLKAKASWPAPAA